MASRKRRTERLPVEPGAATASGGHVMPDVSPGNPALDPLSAPLPSELEAEARERERAEAIASRRARPDGAPGDWETPPPRLDARPLRRVRPVIRRVKRTIKHVDPVSVLKLSLFLYSCLLVVWLALAAVVYWIVDAFGFFDALDEFREGFVIWENLDISLMVVEKWAFLIGLTLVIVGSVVNAFLAFLYNVGSDIVGGIGLTFVERD